MHWWSGLMEGAHPRATRAEIDDRRCGASCFPAARRGTSEKQTTAAEPQLHRRRDAGGGVGRPGRRGVRFSRSCRCSMASASVSAYAAPTAGGTSILVPSFDPGGVAEVIRAKRPNVLVGVPTLFDALANDPSLARTDLSCLTVLFSGAHTLPRTIKERFEALVARRAPGAPARGYGLTEAVTAIMAMPLGEYREGSIGIPFPDMRAAICRSRTDRAAPAGVGRRDLPLGTGRDARVP